jgi:hypothetical protein
MAKWRIAFSIIALLLCGAAHNPTLDYGGMWKVKRSSGFTSTMDFLTYTQGSNPQGTTLIGTDYFTCIRMDSGFAILAGSKPETLYTKGLGDDYFHYNPATADSDALEDGADTLNRLALDGFVGDTLDVTVFFEGNDVDTFRCVVEQAIRYDTLWAKNSQNFNDGFFRTDTLFCNSGDTSIVLTTGSGTGGTYRMFRDRFFLQYPFFRLMWLHQDIADLSDSIWIEVYARHNLNLMGGASGRLNQQMDKAFKVR